MSRNPRRIAAQRTVRMGGQELPLGAAVLEQAESLERAAYLARRAQLAPLPPAAERAPMSEEAWQRQVVALVRRLGWYVYHPKLSRWSERGWPDLSILTPARGLFVECKADGGQLTEEQVHVIDLMLAAGLEVHVMRPWHGLQLVADVLMSGDGAGPTRC